MDSQFISPISIEKFAAYLDGNLPEADMQSISTSIDNSEELQEIIDTCYSIEETYDYNNFIGEACIPDEIKRMDFEIPNLETENTLIASTENSHLDADVAACANDAADAEISIFEDNSLVDSEIPQYPDDSNFMMSEVDTEIDISSTDLNTDLSFFDN